MSRGEKMGSLSTIVSEELKRKTEANRGKGWCLPIALAIPICAGLVEMARVMDFSAINAYINAAVKILSGK